MSDPFGSFLRGLLHSTSSSGAEGEGGQAVGGSGESPHFVNITTPGGSSGAFLSLPMGMGMIPSLVGRGRGGRGTSTAAVGGRGTTRGRSRGSLGSVYSGEVPPMVWIQQEQARTPLRFTATDGTASFDSAQVREEGNRAFKSGDFERAVELYTRAIEMDPNTEINYTNRSFAHFKLSQMVESARDAQEAVRLKPDFFKGHYRLGLALTATGEYATAHRSLQRAFELAPAANRDDIKVALAKCESKMARTPVTPLLMDSPLRLGSGTPQPLFGGQKVRSYLANVTPVDYQALATLVETAAAFREELTRYCKSFEEEKDIVECHTRSQKIKQLIGVATSNQLVELGKDAEEKQEQLRRTLKDQDRDAYFDAKRDRDEAYRLLWTTAEEVQDAVKNLRGIAAEEQNFFRRFGTTSEGEAAAPSAGASLPSPVPLASSKKAVLRQKQQQQELNDEGGEVEKTTAVPPPAAAAASAVLDNNDNDEKDGDSNAGTHPERSLPLERPAVDKPNDLSRTLWRRDEIHQLVEKAGVVLGATNAAAAALRKALEDETQFMQQLTPVLGEAKALNGRLEGHARKVAQSTTKELSDSRLEALDQVTAAVKRVRADETSFKQTQSEGDALLVEEAKLEKQRLLFEKQRIQLQAEIEWFKVRDEPEGRMATLQHHVQTVQKRIADVNTKQKEVQKRILELVATDHPELAWKSMASGSRILRLVKGSGLWLNLSLSDFQIVSTLSSTANSKVYHATRRGEHVAVKEVAINDEKTKQRFQREINIVASCAHPNIVKIKGVFFDGPFAYVLLPYYHQSSVKSRLQKKEPLSWVAVQDMLRQMASGLAYLHERGIVHGDIKPSNILISDDNRPIITDFGIAKDSGRFGEGLDVTVTATSTGGAVAGTTSYMAPELLLGDARRSTSKSDMWALGVTFYEIAASNAFFHNESLGEPGSPLATAAATTAAVGGTVVEIPAVRVGGDEKLADLIASMSVVDVTRRATAYDVLGHPYFSATLSASAAANTVTALTKSDERIDAVRSYIHAVRGANPQKILVSVSRNQMVESLNSIIPQLSDDEMLEPIMVVFQGESGIDEGALTSEMLNLFYTQMVRDKKALVCCENEEEEVVAAATVTANGDDGAGEAQATFMLGSTYLPAEDEKSIPVHLFELLGKVLLKSIVENRPLPLRMNPAVLKYFCGVPVSILDMEEFDRTVTSTLKRLRLLSSEELAASELTFAHFSASFLASYQEGKFLRETQVTSDNVREYVDLRVQYDLIEKRKRALEAVKKGFYSVSCIEPHLKLLSPSDLLLLLCGVVHVPPQTIVDALEFQGFPSSSKTPQYLKEVLLGMSQNNLRRFLELCTSTAAIPATDAMRKIKVLRTGDNSRLPVGHGCVFQLDLPDYNDKKVLEEKLQIALAHVSDGFHIV